MCKIRAAAANPIQRPEMFDFRADADSPSIYVACLNAYNNGFLHGVWINATIDIDEIREQIDYMLQRSPHAAFEPCEEYAIHDYENFHGYSIGEHESIESVHSLSEAIVEHGEAFVKFSTAFGLEPLDAAAQFTEAFVGEYEREIDFIQSDWIELYFPDYGDMPYPLSLDWERIANTVFIDDYLAVESSRFTFFVFLRDW